MSAQEIQGAGHTQPKKSKVEMQFLSIDNPVGSKEVGRRFVFNPNMNRCRLAIDELWEKPDKGTYSVNSPSACTPEHGDEGWKKTAEAAEDGA